MSQPAQQRKQGKTRTQKKDANRSAPAPGAAPAQPAPKLSPRAAAFRARRGGSVTQTPAFTLSRAQEMAYIRGDLRRLVYISSGLLVLMIVILYIIER